MASIELELMHQNLPMSLCLLRYRAVATSLPCTAVLQPRPGLQKTKCCGVLCRALNQAVGRVIQHRHGWGTVLLLDSRFQQPRSQQQLPMW